MCPNMSPGLADVHGQEFETLYRKYEQEGKFMRQVPAREVWSKILESQIETGVPYILYKDNINKTSNQANLGTIRSSNLCAEITEYSDDTETAVCNLASIAVNEFVIPNKDGTYQYDYAMLQKVAGIVCNNLNLIIDINYYPTPECKKIKSPAPADWYWHPRPRGPVFHHAAAVYEPGSTNHHEEHPRNHSV